VRASAPVLLPTDGRRSLAAADHSLPPTPLHKGLVSYQALSPASSPPVLSLPLRSRLTQAEGKKRMKALGKVEVPQEAFMAVLNLDKDIN